MNLLRSERLSAALLLIAATLGLLVANIPAGAAVVALGHTKLTVPWLTLTLSLDHWISDGLLVIFFFGVAVELKREFVIGELRSVSRAAVPTIAAFGGVIVPAGIFVLFNAGRPTVSGWPIPTATDIAFALGALAIFGRWIPTRVRVFLLALAVIDDLIAITIIAVFFAGALNMLWLAIAAVALCAVAVVSRHLEPRSRYILTRHPQWPLKVVLMVLALLTWYAVYQSGVHATIAGVGLGLVMARNPGSRLRHRIEPASNLIILPLFAFSEALVAIPQVSPAQLNPAFWGIVIGVVIAGAIGLAIFRQRVSRPLLGSDLLVIGALSGIGFTVSLLMNGLAFAQQPEVADEGTLAVLLGSGVAIALSAVVVTWRSLWYKKQATAEHPEPV